MHENSRNVCFQENRRHVLPNKTWSNLRKLLFITLVLETWTEEGERGEKYPTSKSQANEWPTRGADE
jgi:hypothetical protein